MHYTPGRIFEESALVTEWVNGLEATRAILVSAAIGSAVSKEGGKHFSELIALLRG